MCMNYLIKMKWLPIVLIALVILNIVTLTAFWVFSRNTHKPQPSKGGAIEFLVKELRLDSVQRGQLKLLRDEHRSESQEIRKLNREAKDAFFDLLQEENVADSILDKAATQSVYYDAELVKATFRHFKKIRAICTPAQKEKFDEIIHEVLRMQAAPQGPPPRRDGERPPHPEQEPTPQN